jgi:hypothetical protein
MAPGPGWRSTCNFRLRSIDEESKDAEDPKDRTSYPKKLPLAKCEAIVTESLKRAKVKSERITDDNRQKFLQALGTQQRTGSGADLRNPQIYTSNFLIEAYFKTAPGQKDATLIQKMDDAGYVLRIDKAGGVTLAVQAVGAKASLGSHGAINDGQWHHVIAEADRKAGTFRIYIDGKQDASGSGLGADASLANDADLYVGGTPQGHNLDGAIDFMRIARGTLADSKTTIEELYPWEFNGPFLYDFTGRERPADGGEAGTIDCPPVWDR